jgi:hypothetical protein
MTPMRTVKKTPTAVDFHLRHLRLRRLAVF